MTTTQQQPTTTEIDQLRARRDDIAARADRAAARLYAGKTTSQYARRLARQLEQADADLDRALASDTTDLTQLTPAQVDEMWSEAMQPAYTAWAKLAETRRQIRRYTKARYEVPAYLTEREAEQHATYNEAYEATRPFDAEYERRGGWTRYLIVVSSSNGHVHRSPSSCGSLTPGVTLVSPLFQFSGNDSDAIVAECGHGACSKCFKDAPVAREQVKPGNCPGSARNVYDGGEYGNPANYAANRCYRHARCPECGAGVSVTSTGKLRGHKAA